MKFIGTLIERKIISPSLGRIIEISIYGFCISFLAYLGGALQSGNRSDWRVALGGLFTTLCVSIISGIQKDMRDKIKEKEQVLNSLNIDTNGDRTI